MKLTMAAALALLLAFTAASSLCVPCSSPALQGFGTGSTFGAGGETCAVTNLNDSGAGSLRDCVDNRNGPEADPTPRVIEFTVGGTITLLSDMSFNQPYLTVDGLSAPSPGITLAKTGNGEAGETAIRNTGSTTCGHDNLIQGIRFQGVWDRATDTGANNAGIMSIDGEDNTNCLENVVLHRVVWIDGQDAAGQIWGSVKNLTISHSLFAYNFHPVSISHFPGGESNQERQFLSFHHNVTAYVHERMLNIRGNVWDSAITQNVFLNWDAFGLPGGYANQFRCRNGGCPLRINMTDNVLSSNNTENGALFFSDSASPAQLYTNGNTWPAGESDRGTAASPFPINDGVTVLPQATWKAQIPTTVGHPYPTAEEQAILAEAAAVVP